MQTEIEGHRARPPVLKRALAGLVLIVAAALAIKLVVGLIMTVFWIIVAVAVVVAVQGVPEMTTIRADWTRLARATENVFTTWEWGDAWQRHIGARAGIDLALGVAKRPSGEIAAILPLAVTRRGPLRLVRFLGAG